MKPTLQRATRLRLIARVIIITKRIGEKYSEIHGRNLTQLTTVSGLMPKRTGKYVGNRLVIGLNNGRSDCHNA